jgi:hypothetical protein
MRKRANLKVFAIIAVILLWTGCGTAAGEVIYVDANTPDNNDGSSWAKAYKYLQDGLADANSDPCFVEIYVADGNYCPDANTADPCGTGNREATFQLINSVAIKGGYAGYGAPDPNARDIELYETILSGDLNGDDEPNFVNIKDNSDDVVAGSGTDASAVLNGFTITAGGGGIYNEQGSPTVSNCTFSGNGTILGGGGMWNINSSPTVSNCTFSGNGAVTGGGMNNYNSNPMVTNCTFSLNSVWSYGGGMCNYYYSSPMISNCIFSGNSAWMGGGMYNFDNSDPNVSNCTFSGNDADHGAGMYNDFSSPTVTNCTFSGNIGGEGCGMYNHGSSPTVTNCTFSLNVDCGLGGGMCNRGGSPTVTNCTFIGNSAVKYGGGMWNYSSSPTLTNCTFTGNSADTGGGMRNSGSSSPTVTNCTFSGNSADNYGGGMYNRDSSSPTLTNCILWGDTAAVDGNEIALYDFSTIDVNYCDIKGGQTDIYKEDSNCTVNWGTGNISANPLFLADIPDQVRLLATSPCIDAGDNNAVPADTADLDNDGNTVEPTPFDLDGRPRFADGDCNGTAIVDMGAYEFAWVYLGDFAGGCDVDFVDFSVLGLTWLLEQGQPGYNPVCDIALPADSFIDEKDLKIFTDNWLAGI